MNRIIIDWFTFSFTDSERSQQQLLDTVFDLLGAFRPDFEQIKGFYGYKDRLYYEGISVHFNGGLNMGVCVEISGHGCRTMEDFYHVDWIALFDEVQNGSFFNITRLDVAFDDFDGVLNIQHCVEHFQPAHLWLTSQWRRFDVVLSTEGSSITCGSPKSDIRLRIYDKAAEQKLSDNYHWIRAELQLRRDRASSFVKQLLDNGFSVGQFYFGVLANYLNLRDPSPGDSNKGRWQLCPMWHDFLLDAEAISIVSPGDPDYGLEDLKHFVLRQAGHAIQTLKKISGNDEFLRLVDMQPFEKNRKYDNLIALYGGSDNVCDNEIQESC